MPADHAVFLDVDTVDRGDLDRAELYASIPKWTFFGSTAAAQVNERIAQAAVVVSNKVPLGAANLGVAEQTRLICVAATGVNNVDLAAAKAAGIQVSNARGYATAAVVQHTLGLMLALATRLPDYHRAVTAGRWQAAEQFCLLDYPIQELAGRTLGIVGYGTLGQAVARLAEALGMRVLVAARPGNERDGRPDRLPLRRLLPQVDVLSLHCPLTPQTRNLIDAEALALLPSHAFLINTARGGIVAEAALAAALRAGRLAGAGVDVLSTEPPNQGNPLLDPAIPNLIVTPHIAWASRAARQRLFGEIAANIQAFVAGEERHRVA